MSYDKLMIVAHPDDETIFGGAQLLLEQGWLVLCVTNGNNKVRRREFKKVMGLVKAEFEIWEYADKWNGDFDRGKLKSDLAEVLAQAPVEKVVTHSLIGEYGHNQHKVLSRLVHELVDQQLYVFSFSKEPLEEELLSRKQQLIACYKSQDIEWLRKYIQFEGIKRVK